MSCPHWSRFPHDLLEATEVGWRRSRREEFSWDNEWITIHHFGCRDVEAFLWSHTKPEEDPGKMMKPRGIDAAGDEGGLESTMETLDHAVGFRVVGCRMVACRPKELVEGCPQQRGEKRTSVRCNVLRNTKS